MEATVLLPFHGRRRPRRRFVPCVAFRGEDWLFPWPALFAPSPRISHLSCRASPRVLNPLLLPLFRRLPPPPVFSRCAYDDPRRIFIIVPVTDLSSSSSPFPTPFSSPFTLSPPPRSLFFPPVLPPFIPADRQPSSRLKFMVLLNPRRREATPGGSSG